MIRRLIVFAIVPFLFFSPEQAHSSIDPSEVLVVVNTREPISQKVADYYCAKRRVPAKNICKISCTTTESVNADEFTTSIMRPIESYLQSTFGSDPAKPGSDPIKAILLTYGVPSVIIHGERLASVNSCLALTFNQTP